MSRRVVPQLAGLFVAAACQLVLPVRSLAETLLTIHSHTDSFRVMGKTQPAKDSEAKVWISGEKVRQDEGESSQIFRFDLGKLYLLDHTDKTWSEVDLPVDWAKLVPKGNEQLVEQLAKAKRAEVTVKPSKEARKIRDWQAQKVQVDLASAGGMRISTVMWVSRELGFYGTYNRMSANQAALQGNLEWSRKLQSLEGFPVLQESTVHLLDTQFKTREELVTAETVTPPPDLFEVPAGYKPKPFDMTTTPP